MISIIRVVPRTTREDKLGDERWRSIYDGPQTIAGGNTSRGLPLIAVRGGPNFAKGSQVDNFAPLDTAETDPLIGKELQGRYRILSRLGAGGMGMVYVGEHLMIRRKVAIKTLHGQYAQDPVIVERFHREALAATSVGNQHIVDVTDMGHLDGGALYMVLEYLDGSDLGKQIDEQGAQSLGRVVRIMLQLCDALSAVHAQGIVHRDLKPDNIFLIRRGDNPDFVKVLDFGISKFKSGGDVTNAKMTATGSVLGTPYFMAPEQAQGLAGVDHRADIYALGAIMYYALCGYYPFEASNVPMLFVKICTEAPPPLRQGRPDLPEEVSSVIERALAKNPANRFSSCAEFKEALLAFQGQEFSPPADLALAATGYLPSAPKIIQRSGAFEKTESAAMRPLPQGISQSDAAATDPIRSRASAPRRAGAMALVGAVFAALALVAGWLWIDRGRGSQTPVAGEAQESAVAPPAVDAPSPANQPAAAPVAATRPTNEGAEQPDVVHVAITTVPSDAELFLDGHRVANPFEAELPKTEAPRKVEARQPGFQTVTQELVLLYPQTVRLTLDPQTRKAALTVRQQVVKEPQTAAEAAKSPASAAFKEPTPALPTAPSPSELKIVQDTPSTVTVKPGPVSPAPAPTSAATAEPAQRGRGQRALKKPF